MSEIPKSKRKTTNIEFFDKAIDLRVELTMYLKEDLDDSHQYVQAENGEWFRSKDFWLYEKIRNTLYNTMDSFVSNIVHANTIYINDNIYEYNTRRKYMTDAIGDLYYLKQNITYMKKMLKVPLNKYNQFILKIDKEIERVKNWRKSDNPILNRIKEKEKKNNKQQ